MPAPLFIPSIQKLFHFIRLYSVLEAAAECRYVLPKDRQFFSMHLIRLREYFEQGSWDDIDILLKSTHLRSALIEYPACFKTLKYEEQLRVSFQFLRQWFQKSAVISEQEKKPFAPLFDELERNIEDWFTLWHKKLNSWHTSNWVEVALDPIHLEARPRIVLVIESPKKPVPATGFQACLTWLGQCVVGASKTAEASCLLKK